MCEYLLQIKNITDIILVNLLQEYAPVVAVTVGNFKTPPVNEIEAQFLSYESCTN
ncbi:hypothetical protein Fmac_025715 [Flemingia macrophylla]|uniref:Uncharacterized protein n=1 Tax=Flemingia macrophylla TaxID=520843 RepID=A0ABD1LT24_9FABA